MEYSIADINRWPELHLHQQSLPLDSFQQFHLRQSFRACCCASTFAFHLRSDTPNIVQIEGDNYPGMGLFTRSANFTTSFKFQNGYIIDGQPDFHGVKFSDFNQVTVPFGPTRMIHEMTTGPMTGLMDLNNQSFIVMGSLILSRFNESIIYDPDIQLGFLFDTTSTTPETSPSDGMR